MRKILKNDVHSQQNKLLARHLSKDHIPPEIKAELNLPENMKQYEVDYNEVRLRDATMAIKTPTWSG